MDTALWIVVAAALTAIMTGAGALPFLVVRKVGDRTIGWSNAAAAGLMLAAPDYLFVETFQPFLPMGLGLVAGAMIWMVFSELYPDALAKVDHGSAATAVTLAFSAMMAFQILVLAH